MGRGFCLLSVVLVLEGVGKEPLVVACAVGLGWHSGHLDLCNSPCPYPPGLCLCPFCTLTCSDLEQMEISSADSHGLWEGASGRSQGLGSACHVAGGSLPNSKFRGRHLSTDGLDRHLTDVWRTTGWGGPVPRRCPGPEREAICLRTHSNTTGPSGSHWTHVRSPRTQPTMQLGSQMPGCGRLQRGGKEATPEGAGLPRQIHSSPKAPSGESAHSILSRVSESWHSPSKSVLVMLEIS